MGCPTLEKNMAYRTILVHLENEERAPGILSAATKIVRKYDAHLIGLFVIPGIEIAPSFGFYIPAEIHEVYRNACLKVGKKLEQAFNKAIGAEGVNSSEFRTVEAAGQADALPVIEHGRMADLIIIGQSDDEKDGSSARELRECVLLEAGRPILFIPYIGTYDKIGEQVLVAWNARREAARGAFDALPLLKDAKNVRVHWVNASDEDEQNNLPGAELAATLSRHGVNVQAEGTVARGISVADELLGRAADFGCDLLVMGGYGHSRTREFVFGGATREILNHMTLPVLMSH
jgi:nucleotide-binding universal stress UspA family protein